MVLPVLPDDAAERVRRAISERLSRNASGRRSDATRARMAAQRRERAAAQATVDDANRTLRFGGPKLLMCRSSHLFGVEYNTVYTHADDICPYCSGEKEWSPPVPNPIPQTGSLQAYRDDASYREAVKRRRERRRAPAGPKRMSASGRMIWAIDRALGTDADTD